MKTTWRVYVLSAVCEDGFRCFYVGYTGLPVRERVAQHKSGKKFCPGCKPRHYFRASGIRLLDTLGPFTTRARAKVCEREVAEGLRRQGNVVQGGH